MGGTTYKFNKYVMNIIKFYAHGQDKPEEFIINWNLGNTCNWDCSYCPSYLHDGSVAWTNTDLVKTNLLKIKNRFFDKNIKIEFMGGEVTLKNDFIDLLKFCKELNFRTSIITNASRTINYWESLVEYLDEAMMSFHPELASKEHYENIIDLCYLHNVKPVCRIAMVKDNFWGLVDYKKYIQEKYSNIDIDYMILYDKENKHNYNGYFYDYDKEQLAFLEQDSHTCFIVESSSGEKQEMSFVQLKSLGLTNFTGFTCGTELSILTVDYRGGASISVCPQRSAINIFKNDIDTLFAPRICEQSECRNPSDLRILKIKN